MEKREFIQQIVLKMVDEKTQLSDIIRFAADTYEAIEDALSHEEKKEEQTEEKKEQSELDGILLASCNLLDRTVLRLRNVGITKLSTLLMFSRKELLQLRAVGKKTITDIEDFLDSVGLYLPDDIRSIHCSYERIDGEVVHGWNYKGKFYTQLEPLS